MAAKFGVKEFTIPAVEEKQLTRDECAEMCLGVSNLTGEQREEAVRQINRQWVAHGLKLVVYSAGKFGIQTLPKKR